jgi:hypothetical protein
MTVRYFGYRGQAARVRDFELKENSPGAPCLNGPKKLGEMAQPVRTVSRGQTAAKVRPGETGAKIHPQNRSRGHCSYLSI